MYNMKTIILIILAVTFHDVLALALVYAAKALLWGAYLIQRIAENMAPSSRYTMKIDFGESQEILRVQIDADQKKMSQENREDPSQGKIVVTNLRYKNPKNAPLAT